MRAKQIMCRAAALVLSGEGGGILLWVLGCWLISKGAVHNEDVGLHVDPETLGRILAVDAPCREALALPISSLK